MNTPSVLEVTFENVGRNNANWTARTPGAGLDFDWLYKQVKQNAALFSSSIDFGNLGADGRGEIYVGGFRCVGHFTAKWVTA